MCNTYKYIYIYIYIFIYIYIYIYIYNIWWGAGGESDGGSGCSLSSPARATGGEGHKRKLVASDDRNQELLVSEAAPSDAARQQPLAKKQKRP
jgi:hypothetical protein